jgi:hypothetical protein
VEYIHTLFRWSFHIPSKIFHVSIYCFFGCPDGSGRNATGTTTTCVSQYPSIHPMWMQRNVALFRKNNMSHERDIIPQSHPSPSVRMNSTDRSCKTTHMCAVCNKRHWSFSVTAAAGVNQQQTWTVNCANVCSSTDEAGIMVGWSHPAFFYYRYVERCRIMPIHLFWKGGAVVV